MNPSVSLDKGSSVKYLLWKVVIPGLMLTIFPICLDLKMWCWHPCHWETGSSLHPHTCVGPCNYAQKQSPDGGTGYNLQGCTVRVPCSLTFLFKAPTMLPGAWANHRETLWGKKPGPLVPSSGWVHKSIPLPTFHLVHHLGSGSSDFLLSHHTQLAVSHHMKSQCACAEPHWEYRLFSREAYGI